MTASSTWAVQMLDVALSRAEREPQGRIAVAILGDADEATGHLALKRIFGGEEARVRAAVTEGHAETLGRADGDVGAKLAGWLQ